MERYLQPTKRKRMDDPIDTVSTSAKQTPGPSDVSNLLSDGPTQPDLKSYPTRLYGTKARAFNKSWYSMHPWLEYSSVCDAVYCFSCRHFGRESFGKSEPAFTRDGFSNWKKGPASLKAHESSVSHKMSMEVWIEPKQQSKTGSVIQNLLDSGHIKLVQENRRYIRAVIEALRYTCCENIAQRGHRENSDSLHRGNFIELLSMLGNFDEIIQKKLESCPSNAKYIHHNIQNEIINIMAGMITSEISEEVKDAEYFALLVDETKDVSKTEQLSIVVRYLHNDDIYESFLGFTPADGLDANSLFIKIKETLSSRKIDKNKCIGQCYDGAAVMSGSTAGVQEKFWHEVPQAVYVHCFAHRLNLVLVDSVHSIQIIAEFFASVQKLHNFVSTSVVHAIFTKIQKENDPKKQIVELKSLSETRWSCQDVHVQLLKKHSLH